MSFIGYGFNAVWAYFEATKQMVSDGTLASPYNGVSTRITIHRLHRLHLQAQLIGADPND